MVRLCLKAFLKALLGDFLLLVVDTPQNASES